MLKKKCGQRSSLGFSLLELMIAMFILIILISVAIPTYQRSVQHAKETVLHENLWQMRRAIDQFYADKGHLPKNIDDLVNEKYLRERPIDPVTESTEWNEVQGEDPAAKEGETGMKDVKSTADGIDSNGQEYSKY
ncbi:MAG: general secretion pathway protein G [Acidobacteria bacterium OLB17]|nr:MAG: general secretion pathway protein G [Acidobacteria bacterium OLB17]MCZ2389744.1 type II secretion system GspH family protein [Acidobacteriota bacterium]